MGFAINTVTLSGNMTRDPEIRMSQNGGNAVLRFGIAYNERRKNQAGGYDDRPHFFEVTVFGRQAEWLANHSAKGSPITVSGTLEHNTWTDKEGNRREKVGIIARDIVLGERAKNGREPDVLQARATYQPPPAAAPIADEWAPPAAAAPNPYDADDDDIPF